MANTKLSNVNGLERFMKGVPDEIENYVSELHQDVENIRNESLYFLEMSTGRILINIFRILFAGATFCVRYYLVDFLHLPYDEVTKVYCYIWQAIGFVLIFVSIHSICRMYYGGQLNKCDKKIKKYRELYRNQYLQKTREITPNYLVEKINSFEDIDVDEICPMETKLEKKFSKIRRKEKFTSRLILVLRIVIPAVLYIVAITGLLSVTGEWVHIPACTFVIMFIFCRRLGLLLEYKVGKLVRLAMSVPAIVYGIILYWQMNIYYVDIYLVDEILLKYIPERLRMITSMSVIVPFLQVLCLVLVVWTMDYYSEKKYMQASRTKKQNNNRNEKKVHSMVYTNSGIALYAFLMCIYGIFMLLVEPIVRITGVIGLCGWGAIIGLVWRLISPIWPMKCSKTICRYWGIRHTVIIEMFAVFLLLMTAWGMGIVLTAPTIMISIIAMGVSWIVFAFIQGISKYL